jgi:ankyrin repeat protein
MKNFMAIILFLFVISSLMATPEEDFLTDLRDSRLQDARFFLDDKHSVNMALHEGNTALIIMCKEQRSLEVRWLLDQGADPDLTDPQGLTPLMHAAIKGNRNLAQILLQEGAFLNLQSPLGYTALLLAVNNVRTDLARYLEEKGGRIIDGHYDHPVLSEIWNRRQHYARALSLRESRWVYHEFLSTLIKGDYETLRTMIETGTDPNAADTEGVSALMMAASRDDIYTADLLLSQGANPALKDNLDLSALWYAAFENHQKLIDLLLESGITDDAAYLESSALFGAFASGSYPAMIRLIDAGWDTEKTGRLGASLVHYATFMGDLRTLVELKKAGASLGRVDGDNLTAMDYLILGYHLNEEESIYIPVASFLREEGVDATLDPSVLDNIKLSRIIYSKW